MFIGRPRTTSRARGQGTRLPVDRGARVADQPHAGGRPDTHSSVCYGRRAMEQNDDVGYWLSLVLFTVAIPIIGLIGAYLAAQMPN